MRQCTEPSGMIPTQLVAYPYVFRHILFAIYDGQLLNYAKRSNFEEHMVNERSKILSLILNSIILFEL